MDFLQKSVKAVDFYPGAPLWVVMRRSWTRTFFRARDCSGNPARIAEQGLRNWSGKPGFCVSSTQKCAHSWLKKVNAVALCPLTVFSGVYYSGYMEKIMPQSQTMTLHEKLQIGMKSYELEDQGKFEEAKKLRNQIPMAPYLAKFFKDHLGLDALLKTGWNLSEAVAEYGPEFLSN
jgi:hypothetical protein